MPRGKLLQPLIALFFTMIPEQLFCQACGCTEYRTEEKGGHLGAYCSDCGKWIKWLPKGKPKFYFGKYKAYFVDEVNDLAYLTWVQENIRMSASMRNAVEQQIANLNPPKC